MYALYISYSVLLIQAKEMCFFFSFNNYTFRSFVALNLNMYITV